MFGETEEADVVIKKARGWGGAGGAGGKKFTVIVGATTEQKLVLKWAKAVRKKLDQVGSSFFGGGLESIRQHRSVARGTTRSFLPRRLSFFIPF